MSYAAQSQSDFVDIPMNKGCKVGFGMFKNIMKGRYHGEMQLAYEQYIGDCKDYGTAHRCFRYTILNGVALKLQYPSPSGPALAAPIMHPGLQNANGQMQASRNPTPYTSQFNQPVSNFLGPIDHSEVQNIRYPSARTAQKSAPQSRQLNPRAVDFKVSSTVNNLSKSAPPSGWPTARTASVRPPGLPEIPQPQSVPSNVHRGFSTPDALSNARERYVHPDIIPSAPTLALPKANTAPAQPSGLPETQQPQLAPSRTFISANSPLPPYSLPIPPKPQIVPRDPHRGVLKLNTCLGLFDFNTTRDSLISPSPLDLDANSSSAPNYPHPPPPQSSRRSSKHSSDAPSHSSSDESQSPGWRFDHGIRLPVPVETVSKSPSPGRTIKSNVPEANTTNKTSQGPQNGEADTAPRDPSSELPFNKDETPNRTELFNEWWRSARPNSRLHFLRHFGYVSTECQCEYNSRHPQGRANTVSNRTNPPAVGNGMNPSPKMAEVAATPTLDWLAAGIALRTSPRPQLPNGEEGNEAGESSSSGPQPPVEVQPEAQSSGETKEVDQDLLQRLDGYSLTLTGLVDEVLGTMINLEAKLDRGKPFQPDHNEQ